MAAFEAVERLQKFDWLIQKLHSLRSSLQSEQGLQELQKLHALQLLQRNGVQFNGSSIGESEEEDKMEMCKMDGDEDEQDDIEDEPEEIEEDTEIMDEDEENDNEENDERPRPPTEEMLPLQNCLPLLSSTGNHPSDRPLSPDQFSTNLKNEASEDSVSVKENFEDSEDAHENQNGFSGPRYGRFPTGLFPPLPFDTMLGEESDLKVGNFVATFEQVLLASTSTSTDKIWF